mmetsp:Transcript_75260/g.218559  ORF Transcript_75260/g.218559 Transcript_75260/m.218559 type:complete len:102 (-) Transcript_75260:543-848(-)
MRAARHGGTLCFVQAGRDRIERHGLRRLRFSVQWYTTGCPAYGDVRRIRAAAKEVLLEQQQSARFTDAVGDACDPLQIPPLCCGASALGCTGAMHNGQVPL